MTLKIKQEDKAAFLNRMKKANAEVSSNQIKDNDLEDYFEVTFTNPKQIEAIELILKQSPKINTVKEMKKLTRDELKEMIRQELNEKKKVEDKKEKLNEASDVLIAGIATLLGVGTTVLFPFIKALLKTPKGEREKLISDFRNSIENKMSGGI